jgi:hypothetical protein
LGLALVILSMVLFILGARIEVPTIVWIGCLLSGVGLALYANGSGRSLVLGFIFGLLPFLGPLIGLLVFAGKKKPQTGMSDAALKWNVLLYVACLVLAALLAPSALWPQMFLTENDTWSALTPGGHMGNMLGKMLALFVVSGLLFDIIKTSVSPGWRKASAWLVIRAVLVGLVIVICWFGSIANKDGEQKTDSLIEESFGQIKPGMERAVVHELILETNAALVPKPHALFSITEREEYEYEKVINAMKDAKAGIQVNFKEQKFNEIFFHVNEYFHSKNPEHREIFVRFCCTLANQRPIDSLLIEYDPDDHLKSVLYLQSRNAYGSDREKDCHVRLEIPASKDKQYPYPCPPDVQDF